MHTAQFDKAYILILLNLKIVTVEQALHNTGLSLEQINQQSRLDVSLASKILRNVRRFATDDNWPVTFGAHLGIASHGPVGYATISAPTVGKALMTFVEWFQIRCETYTGEIKHLENQIQITIRDTTADPLFEQMFFEAFSRALEVLVEQLTGKAQQGETSIAMKSAVDHRCSEMQAMYNSQLSFSATENKLLLPKELWYQRSPLWDKESFDFNLNRCQQLLQQLEQSGRIDLQVKSTIQIYLNQMLTAASPESEPPSLRQIADSLHLTERTLIRKLKAYQTSYKQILDAEREALAERLLKDAKYTVFQVADILGYKEPANFCRAFKRWKQVTPSYYRRYADNLE